MVFSALCRFVMYCQLPHYIVHTLLGGVLYYNFNPAPPGLLARPQVTGGGGFSRPLQSRGPLVVESLARQHSKAELRLR